MAAAPAFAATPRFDAVALDTTNAGRDGTGTIGTVITAGGSGSKIEEIVVKADGDPADCTIVFYIHDGAAFSVWDEWDISNPAAGSATVVSFREARTYDNLILPVSHSLRASITVAPTAGKVWVLAFGGDF